MAEYQKYMFDNFVVAKDAEEKTIPVVLPELEEEVFVEEEGEVVSEPQQMIVEEVEVEPVIETVEPVFEPEPKDEPEVEEESEPEPEPQIVEKGYSEEEFVAAVKQAETEAYEQGYNAAIDQEAQKQNILLEDIKNQLMMIFAGLESKQVEWENASLKFALAAVRKVFPTLEKERAEAEIKTFLSDNFANFAMQDSLSFSFHPDMVSLVADSIGRLAQQNDFEGKIAVHKDKSLGLSDCRIEWKSGGVERVASKILDKVETLIDESAQEREHG